VSRCAALRKMWHRRSMLSLAWAFSVLAFSTLFLLDAWHVYARQSAALDRQYDKVLVQVTNIWAASVKTGHHTAEVAIFQSGADEFNDWSVEGYRHGVFGRSGQHFFGSHDVQSAVTGVLDTALTSDRPVLGDGVYRGQPVRTASVAVRWGHGGAVPAVLTVVEPPQLRIEARGDALRAVFLQSLWRWLLALAVVAVLLWQLLHPLQDLRDELESRSPSSAIPIAEQRPAELAPLVRTLNQLIAAQRASVQKQRDFLADASHQLRTPLAVLRTQLQGLSSGELSAHDTLPKMLRTVDRSTNLANQLLSVAKVDQLTQEASWVPVDLATVVAEVGLEFGPLMARKRLDFDLDAVPVRIRTDAWMLGELAT
jgi:signal transduction histidine kinase